MLPKSHPLIEAAVKPLADNAEQQLAATAILEETIVPYHPSISETLTRLEKIDPRMIRVLPAIFLGIAAAITLITAISIQIREIRLVFEWFHTPFFYSPEPPPLSSGLTPQQRLILGDPKLSLIRQKELLYESDPENPAYFCEYLTAYVSQNGKLPPGYFETVARIAPQNSFFLYYAAGQIGGDSVERKRSKNPSNPQRLVEGVRLAPLPTEREHAILDQAAFDEAISLIEKAATLPTFETYGNQMIAVRQPLFPRETLAQSMVSLASLYGSSSHVISLRKIADLLDAKAQLLSKAGEKERFLSLVENQRHFVRGLANNPEVTLINELVYLVIASSTVQYFHWAADRLDLTALSEGYEKQMLDLQDDRDRNEIRRKKESDNLAKDRGSVLSGLTIPMVSRQASNPPPLTTDDLKPLRLVDHEIASRLGISAAALIIAIICLPVYFFRYHSPRAVRIPAIRLSKLLRPVDWAWIILGGTIMPIVVFLAINRLTPLGGREYGISHFLFLFPGVQLVAILLNLLLAPAVLIRWRLSKPLAPFGIRSRPGVVSIGILFLVLVWSLCAYPFILKTGLTIPALIGMAAIPALWLANVFLNVLSGILGKPAGRIPRIATTAALLPTYATAIIALCLTLPLFTASEKHWMKKETLFRIDPDAPGFGAYEYKVAAQKRKEINAILER